MNTFADIAIPVAIDKTFTYLIPPELRQAARIGVRTVVPFGRKYANGLIVGLPPSSSVPSLKPIKDILDATPVVSEELLRLCRWIADYYVTPLGEVLKAALPYGFASTSKRLVRATGSATQDAIAHLRKSTPKRAEILSMLAEHGPMFGADLQKRTGVKTINAMLNEMEHAGYVESEEYIPHPTVKPKTKQFVVLDQIDDDRLASELASLSPRKKKARHLLQFILELRRRGTNEMAVADLLKGSGASSSTLKEFAALLPVVLREVSRQTDYGTEEQTRTIALNAVQRQVLQRITDGIDAGHHTFLLHGVTGSGKTQVYIEAIRHCLARKKTAIVLVPEISLTPQTVRRFNTHFGERVAVLHSRMSPGERHDVWRQTLRGKHGIVIGPRSAVFAPLHNLGLIVVDEEHESSYKQFDALPRYNARDVAVVRGSLNQSVVVLGSATPSVESYYNAMYGKYTLLEMPTRVDDTRMPDITIVDLTTERKREYLAMKESLPVEQQRKLREFQQSSVSSVLKEKILDRISRKEGIILLQNRRGFAPFSECPDCGYTETCERCNVTLTYHLAKKHLRCHYCGQIRTPHDECPQCKGRNIRLYGVGTQRVEQDLSRLFPAARIIRMDMDSTTRKGAHDRLLRKFADSEADILLGTQMVAKGLDFPRVTLVGVISADTQMMLPDFRSSERTFQLLTQVSGRAGRSTLHGEVIIQTQQPTHYTLQHVVGHDFKMFYEQELQSRNELSYPPFSRLVLIETKGENEDAVRRQAERFARLLNALMQTNGESKGAFTVLGPAPAVIGKIKNQYRWHIIIKNLKTVDPSGLHLRQALRKTLTVFEARRPKAVRVIIDVDPVGLM